MSSCTLSISNEGECFGLPVDQFKYLLCMMLAYPLGYGHTFLPSPTLKHLYSIVVGVAFAVCTLGPLGWIHSVLSSSVAYLILLILPKNYSHVFVFVWVCLYLTASHVYRAYTDPFGWTMDFTGPQMVLTLKISSFAFNVYDGTRDPKSVRPEHKVGMVDELPGTLEYFGYVFFFPQFLAGPVGTFADYRAFTTLKLFKETKGRIPSTLAPALIMMGKAFACLAVHELSSNYPHEFYFTDEFANMSFLAKIGTVYVTQSRFRARYYFCWLLAEGGCIACGLGYNGVDDEGQPRWDRISNVNIVAVETAQSFKVSVENWNTNVAEWLRRDVYLRLRGEDRGSFWMTLVTNLVSAMWHGVYPGYYLSFIMGAIATVMGRRLRRHLRPVALQGGPVVKGLYDCGGWVLSTVWLAFGTIPFVILDWHKSLYVWSTMHYFGVTITFAMHALITMYEILFPRKSDKKTS